MSCPSNLSRRSFLVSLSGLLAAELSLPSSSEAGGLHRAQTLPTELSPEEKAVVESSAMAGQLEKYFHEGYSCSESILMVTLRFLHKSEDLIWAAAGFGGGMGRRDLCGLLTGGVIGLGMAAGELPLERETAKEHCSQAVRSYWEWWDKQAPPKCADIRKPGSSGAVCTRLGMLASACVESLIEQMRA